MAPGAVSNRATPNLLLTMMAGGPDPALRLPCHRVSLFFFKAFAARVKGVKKV
jgi:hypothetical protein